MAAVFLLLLAAGCGSHHGHPEREQKMQPVADASAGPPSSRIERDDQKPYTIVEARHVIFHESTGVHLRAEWLQGRLYPTRKGVVPSLDDPTTFKVEIEQGKTEISLADLSTLLRNTVLKDSRLSGIRLRSLGPNQIQINATLHEVVPLPVQLTGEIGATQDGRVSLHIDRLKLFKVPFKGMLRFMRLKPASLIHAPTQKGIEAHGDSVYLSTDELLPPPRNTGLVTSVHCTPDGSLEEDYGRKPSEKPALSDWDRTRWRNYIRLTGGTIQFGKLTMQSADLTLLDSSPGDWFEFDLAHYREQLAAGEMRMTAAGALHVFVPDITKIDALRHPSPTGAN